MNNRIILSPAKASTDLFRKENCIPTPHMKNNNGNRHWCNHHITLVNGCEVVEFLTSQP